MIKQKLTNWKKHLGGGAVLCAFYVLIELLGPIAAILVAVVAWEVYQLVSYVLNNRALMKVSVVTCIKYYLQCRWLDCLVDMFMGVLGFTALFMVASLLGLLPGVKVVF